MDPRDEVVDRIRARAEQAVPPAMSLDPGAVRAAGRGRLRARRGLAVGAGLGAVAAVAAVAMVVSGAGGLGRLRGSGPVAPAGDPGAERPAIGLRLVVATTTGTCAAPPLLVDEPGSTCDLTGETSYQLGEALAEVRPTAVEPIDGSTLLLSFDATDAATLADVTGAAVGGRLAMLLDGWVVSAPQVMGAITVGEVALALGDGTEAQQVAAALEGSRAPAGVAVYEPVGEGGDGALLTGTLVEHDGCTYVVDEAGTTWLPVFARGVTVQGGALAYDGARLAYGSTVSLGGGGGGFLPGDAVPATCTTDVSVWRVAQPG